mmetsp:Transcript_14267/g.32420  ORF Transcript_14267/g.32420 Transcript_14267/m.32420 type:complete len:206 (+) Transcript_14267:1302-1919(+)
MCMTAVDILPCWQLARALCNDDAVRSSAARYAGASWLDASCLPGVRAASKQRCKRSHSRSKGMRGSSCSASVLLSMMKSGDAYSSNNCLLCRLAASPSDSCAIKSFLVTTSPSFVAAFALFPTPCKTALYTPLAQHPMQNTTKEATNKLAVTASFGRIHSPEVVRSMMRSLSPIAACSVLPAINSMRTSSMFRCCWSRRSLCLWL